MPRARTAGELQNLGFYASTRCRRTGSAFWDRLAEVCVRAFLAHSARGSLGVRRDTVREYWRGRQWEDA